MDATDTFLLIASTRARERLEKRNANAAERLESAFRRNVTVIGFDAHRLLDGLGIPHRYYASTRYFPGRVLLLDEKIDESSRPKNEAIVDLLARGGSVIVVGRGFAAFNEHANVVRIPAPLFPKTVPELTDEQNSEARAKYERSLGRWVNKYCRVAEAIAESF